MDWLDIQMKKKNSSSEVKAPIRGVFCLWDDR